MFYSSSSFLDQASNLTRCRQSINIHWKEPGKEFSSHTLVPEIDVLPTGFLEELSSKLRRYEAPYECCYYPS